MQRPQDRMICQTIQSEVVTIQKQVDVPVEITVFENENDLEDLETEKFNKKISNPLEGNRGRR